MKSGYCIAFVTAPDLETGRKIARAALAGKVAACANIVPQVESHYWWQGKIESSAEVLVLFKTSDGLVSALEEVVVRNHPYDTPEFVVVEIKRGSEKYLKWLGGSVEGEEG
ncbi:MAG: divalent-cation tolerance protein CutA [Verrucomicrobiota bacterium]|nr:divalent-cation tolerance protein CutA [Verrucomicrobiota bacterium]